MPISILRTKLHRPPMDGAYLHREHLLDRLNQGRHRPLTLVSAPAGYGKSSLLSSWLESCDIPSGWVSLDENDNNLRTFLAYFLAAVRKQYPNAGNHTKALLKSSRLPSLPVCIHSLANELDQIGSAFILVLDDYHAINDKVIHGLIAELLQHPPGPLHLVISTRVDPMLPLERFRARDQMTEIRVRDLRFSLEETRTFLEQLIGAPLAGTAAAKLEEKTEGWVTGLRLAALSLLHRPDPERVVAKLPEESRYITDYLFAELLADQPEKILECLLATAILDRFCAPLCDAVCIPGAQSLEGTTGGHNFLKWLEKSGLLVVPLDDQAKWFRYHHMFQKLLQRRLKHRFGAQEISEFHRRASQWFAENNLIDEAIQYALAGGDANLAAQVVEHNRHAPLNEDKWYVLERWLSKLPGDIVRQRPELLLAQAWVFNFQFALWAIPPLLEAIEKLSDEELQKLHTEELDLFNGIFSFWQGQAQRSKVLLERALERIPAANIGVRNEAEIYLALSNQIAGHGKATVHSYRKKIFNERSEGTRKLRLLGAVLFVHLLSGDLVEAEEGVRQLKEMAARINDAHIEAWAYYLQGNIQYQWNNLKAASHSFSQAVQRKYFLDANVDIDSYAGLIFSYQAMGQPDKAAETMTQLLEFAQASDNPNFLPLARSIQARLWLMQGDVSSAVNWIETADITFDTGTMIFWLDVPRITHCRVLVARDSEASWAEAAEKLQKHLRFSQMTHNTPQTVEMLLLQAMIFQKQARTDEAMVVLEQALTLSRPGGYIRPFVNMGNPMAELLRRLLPSSRDAGFIGRALTAFDALEPADERDADHAPDHRHPWVHNQLQNAPLTNRELEILSFLGQGLQNKQIAARLFISTETVKKHTSSIYKKLDSHNRQQAVANAHRIGLLPLNT